MFEIIIETMNILASVVPLGLSAICTETKRYGLAVWFFGLFLMI